MAPLDTPFIDLAEAASGRAADQLVGALEARIASGDLADGAHLPAERDLMAEFGTSRTVVREAIARLASRGLVESRPRYRPVVRRPGYDAALSAVGGVVTHLLKQPGGVKNLYDTRIYLEAALARTAALSARKDDIAALRDALEANQEAIPDSQRFYATDVAFHAVLYRVPRNPIFPAVHKAFTSWLASHWQQMPRSPERNRINYLSHKAIFDAIVERDPDAAEKALTSHLNAAWEYVRGTFED
ncbi:FCD domain-containing protein [Chthonobacter rhizosphaerae]|uniref:FCD domain-containing protein n=1 Tax=Chthonobacter rhizosphaerae TaxID=2735553 RepID=UPI0015EED339|nr:FCD domain-containing protein [Chthonobacter rhizosphaerae]